MFFKGLPFADNSFDFVHQRLPFTALPLTAWPAVVRDLARVTAPGGWLELLEDSFNVIPSGPATQRCYSLGVQLAALRGLDAEGVVISSLDRYMLDAGLIHVKRQVIEVPLREWGGRIGSLLALNIREACIALSGPIAGHFHIAREEYLAMVEAMVQEGNELKAVHRYAAAYGQKP
jgi:SAM-dependent methyltransferase